MHNNDTTAPPTKAKPVRTAEQKAAKAAYDKKRRAEHPELRAPRNARARAEYAANPELRAKKRASERHPEKRAKKNSRGRVRYAARPEERARKRLMEKILRASKKPSQAALAKRRATNRAWRERNAAKVRANNKRYQQANPEKAAAHNRKHRAMKMGMPGGHTEAEWCELKKRFRNRCVCCGEKKPLQRDHVIPVGQPGATDNIVNIQPLCSPCNTRKRNFHSVDFRLNPFCGVQKGQMRLIA